MKALLISLFLMMALEAPTVAQDENVLMAYYDGKVANQYVFKNENDHKMHFHAILDAVKEEVNLDEQEKFKGLLFEVSFQNAAADGRPGQERTIVGLQLMQ
ncbi:hypothetical protein [Maribacter sp. 2307ULW6-5]|uniref:hypothetical protein n=1 Tax=Maribacter sp. 2307ULW6-5 TaxID=3386275 RepID=UPI0039BD4514